MNIGNGMINALRLSAGRAEFRQLLRLKQDAGGVIARTGSLVLGNICSDQLSAAQLSALLEGLDWRLDHEAREMATPGDGFCP
jgi:hypothetical protein